MIINNWVYSKQHTELKQNINVMESTRTRFRSFTPVFHRRWCTSRSCYCAHWYQQYDIAVDTSAYVMHVTGRPALKQTVLRVGSEQGNRSLYLNTQVLAKCLTICPHCSHCVRIVTRLSALHCIRKRKEQKRAEKTLARLYVCFIIIPRPFPSADTPEMICWYIATNIIGELCLTVIFVQRKMFKSWVGLFGD